MEIERLWKPIAIALLLAIPLGYIDLISVEALPFFEAARTLLVLALMLCSVETVWLRGRVHAALQS